MTTFHGMKCDACLLGLALLSAAVLWPTSWAWSQGSRGSVLTLKRSDYQKRKVVEKKVTMRTGATQTFQLEVASGSGYGWEATRKGTEVGNLSRKAGRNVSDEEGGRKYGRPVYAVYEFKASKPGKTTLEFQLRGPGAKTAETTLRVEVQVKGADD